MTLDIEVRHLDKTYRRQGSAVHALADCTLEVPAGGWATLIGASGCGKSTLLRVLADVVRPSAGSVSLCGMSPREARASRSFALVSQQAALLPWRKLAANVELGLEIVGIDKAERRRRAAEAIELVGLSGFEASYPHELSGGMRQRAAIARALALRPRVLLMDEPFGALDELTRGRMNLELLRILEETSATLLLITHSIAEAVMLSDTVFVMSPRPGRIVCSFDVGFGHDRGPQTREDPDFARLESGLRHALETGSADGLPSEREKRFESDRGSRPALLP